MTEYKLLSQEAISAFEMPDTFVPEHMRDSIIRYLEAGQISMGSFLSCVIVNDLKEAVGKADDINQLHLVHIVHWLWNYAPAHSWGRQQSINEYQCWLNKKGYIGSNNWEVYNPHNKSVDELPVIYGFNNGGSPGWWSGQLLAEDGEPLGGHVCSDEIYMEGDLGVHKGSRPDRHETFRKHYQDGYKMEFVSFDDVESHSGLMAAIKKCEEKYPKEKDDVVQK